MVVGTVARGKQTFVRLLKIDGFSLLAGGRRRKGLISLPFLIANKELEKRFALIIRMSSSMQFYNKKSLILI